MNASEIREQARQNVISALQTGDVGYGEHSTTLMDAVGQEAATDLLHARFSAFHDLVSLSKDMRQMGERIQREVAGAVEYASGNPGSFNSLGVLQADGSRFDGYCMLFPVRVDQAIAAEVAVLKALTVANPAVGAHRFEEGDLVRAADSTDESASYGEVTDLTWTNGVPSYTLYDPTTNELIEDVLDNADLIGETL